MNSEFIGNDCSIEICSITPCSNGATCEKGTCLCANDFTGEFCSDVIRHCTTSTCTNGGTCINQPGGYICLCSGLWHGNQCEIDGRESTPTTITTTITTTKTATSEIVSEMVDPCVRYNTVEVHGKYKMYHRKLCF